MYIVSIDIGLFHLGFIGCEINEDYSLNKVEICELINLKELVVWCDVRECKFEHDLCMSDYMYHFFSKYGMYLDRAEYILVEQQPPMGFISIQELIRFQYRKKTVVISPNAVHSNYGIGHMDYDNRKKFTVKFSEKYLCKFDSFRDNERQHDLADSFVMLKYFLGIKYNEYLEKKRYEEYQKNFSGIIKTLESFRFTEDLNS